LALLQLAVLPLEDHLLVVGEEVLEAEELPVI
jgi:hypothetical protein